MSMIESHNICFLGQTGFGKSSLINALFGTCFATDPLVSCTKELYSVTAIHQKDGCDRLITVYDTPGIGEFSNNSKYQVFYNLAVSKADHIVLVVTLDRIDATSQELLESIRPFIKNDDVRFTIAINQIDSRGVGNSINYVPWDKQTNSPTAECWNRIETRFCTIKTNYGVDIDFLSFEIVPVCAFRRYGIETLKKRILI